jgi:hypothetical protein
MMLPTALSLIAALILVRLPRAHARSRRHYAKIRVRRNRFNPEAQNEMH